MKEQKLKQNYNIHLLRILAAFLVVLIHVSAINWYTMDQTSINWNITNILNAIGRSAVPIFFMISGTLLLGKQEIDTKKIFLKQILKLIIIFIVWSLIYALYEMFFVREASFSIEFIKEFIKVTTSGPYHFWYIPAIIGVYILLPILNCVAKSMDQKVGKYLFRILMAGCIIHTISVTSIIPYSEVLNQVITKIPLADILVYSNYALLGYFLSNYDFSKRRQKQIYILGVISLPLSIIITAIDCNITGIIIEPYYLHFPIFVFFQVIALFTYFKNKKFKIQEIYSKQIKMLSSMTLGIYIIHPLIIFSLVRYNLLGVNNYSPLFMIPLMTISVFLISSLITKIIQKIKYLKDWII